MYIELTDSFRLIYKLGEELPEMPIKVTNGRKNIDYTTLSPEISITGFDTNEAGIKNMHIQYKETSRVVEYEVCGYIIFDRLEISVKMGSNENERFKYHISIYNKPFLSFTNYIDNEQIEYRNNILIDESDYSSFHYNVIFMNEAEVILIENDIEEKIYYSVKEYEVKLSYGFGWAYQINGVDGYYSHSSSGNTVISTSNLDMNVLELTSSEAIFKIYYRNYQSFNEDIL